MNNKSIKTHFDLNVFLTFLVLLICGFGLFAFRVNSKVDCTNVGFDVITNSYTTEDLIEFKSMDASGVDWEWDFGDSDAKAYRSDVVHQFKKEGTYEVALKMNGQCVSSKKIVISKRKKLVDPELIPNIVLPEYVRVGQEVVFENNSSFANSWQWSFGETMAIDGDGRKEKYSYKTPGEKTILLVVNGDRRHEAKQRITVLPELRQRRERNPISRVDHIENVLQQIDDKPAVQVEEEEQVAEAQAAERAARITISSDEMQQLLIGYSGRNVDDVAIRNYFCYSNIPVFSSTGKRFTVSQFFKEIRDVNKLEVKQIKMVKDQTTGCVKSMTINMRTKKGLFWKTF
ncbi:PKD domain-containing protein [Maribacter sp. 2-571]|uniref:PKD domain-containing protein n=1 Tax=Maribacter sp. 2-571 TaxID=3417569 RepID=UPI003D33F658